MSIKLEIFLAIFAVILTRCNSSLIPPDGRIVGGRGVSILKHPHQCSLRYKSCTACAFSHLCGASVYKANILLTATHCLRGREAKNFAAVCGTDNRRGGDGAIVTVDSTIMHEDYNPITYDNDVGIVFLGATLPIDNVTIAAIPLVVQQPENGAKAYVTGWGSTTQGGIASNKLLEVELPIVGTESCDASYGGQRITENMLCAGAAAGGKDACQGDSGGPLVVKRQLAGIVSWGRGCARPGLPGVYANVAYFKKWIEEKTLKYGI